MTYLWWVQPPLHTEGSMQLLYGENHIHSLSLWQAESKCRLMGSLKTIIDSLIL